MGDLLVLMTFTVNQIEIDLNMSYIYKTKLTVPCRDSVSYLSKVCSRWRADLCKGCFAESSLISNNLKENVIECNWLWIIYREKVVVVGQIWWVIVLIEWMKEKKRNKNVFFMISYFCFCNKRCCFKRVYEQGCWHKLVGLPFIL